MFDLYREIIIIVWIGVELTLYNNTIILFFLVSIHWHGTRLNPSMPNMHSTIRRRIYTLTRATLPIKIKTMQQPHKQHPMPFAHW